MTTPAASAPVACRREDFVIGSATDAHGETVSPYKPDDEAVRARMYWPRSYGDERNLFHEFPTGVGAPLVTRQTPLSSAGSCFALNIARRLQKIGYNYVLTEPDPKAEDFYQFSARWGTVFNVPCMRQLVERAFGLIDLPKLVHKVTKKGQTSYYDPFRHTVCYDSMEEYIADYERHIALAREALLQAEVFVFTLGVNEVWHTRDRRFYFSYCPYWHDDIANTVLKVENNVRELKRMLEVWKAHNPKIKLIISVSPVPLHATFRANEWSVIVANCHSKSTLRVAAEEFVNAHPDSAYYFPAYETVLYCSERAWKEDQRHVSEEAIGKVMDLFDRMFVVPEKSGVQRGI